MEATKASGLVAGAVCILCKASFYSHKVTDKAKGNCVNVSIIRSLTRRSTARSFSKKRWKKRRRAYNSGVIGIVSNSPRDFLFGPTTLSN